MPMPVTFSGMRGDGGRRSWYRLSDLIEAAAAVGVAFTRRQIRAIIAELPRPTVKRYGHWHYEQHHMDAVMAASRTTLDLREATGLSFASQR